MRAHTSPIAKNDNHSCFYWNGSPNSTLATWFNFSFQLEQQKVKNYELIECISDRFSSNAMNAFFIPFNFQPESVLFYRYRFTKTANEDEEKRRKKLHFFILFDNNGHIQREIKVSKNAFKHLWIVLNIYVNEIRALSNTRYACIRSIYSAFFLKLNEFDVIFWFFVSFEFSLSLSFWFFRSSRRRHRHNRV